MFESNYNYADLNGYKQKINYVGGFGFTSYLLDKTWIRKTKLYYFSFGKFLFLVKAIAITGILWINKAANTRSITTVAKQSNLIKLL
jgi:hypothetical protein